MAATCTVNLPIIKTCGFENYAITEIFFLLTKHKLTVLEVTPNFVKHLKSVRRRKTIKSYY